MHRGKRCHRDFRHVIKMRLARNKVRDGWRFAGVIPRKWTQGRRIMNHENGWKAGALRTTRGGGWGESDDEEERVAFLIGEWADFSTPWKTSRQEPRTLPALPPSTKNWKVNNPIYNMRCTTCACPRSPANGISTIRFIVYRPCCMRISILTFVALWLLRFSESSPPPPFVSIPLFFFFFASMTMNGWTGRDSNSKKWSNREFILILGLSMIKWIFFSES